MFLDSEPQSFKLQEAALAELIGEVNSATMMVGKFIAPLLIRGRKTKGKVNKVKE